ncbi:glycoside hydrolase family 3 C-terminal domain-containing protein [Hyphobacterium sp. CCMP332]|nr:glycoside hydrolase family 3 C-terminal domain-containing protein [Hyphobacterium sp. CCMP332]
MKTSFICIVSAYVILFLISCKQNDVIDTEEAFIDSLVNQMTLEEKAGQMCNISLMALARGEFWMHRDTIELDAEKMAELIINKHVGSVQNLGSYPMEMREWRKIISILHEYNQKNSRLVIPIIYGIDAVHGANYTAKSTIFPHQLGLAATWNTELAKKTGSVTSYEIKASGIPWNYAPVLDVSKQPLWGRIFESFGEDTYLSTEMGLAYIKGAQGDDISDFDKSAVCLKHFIGYGMPYNGKDRSPTYLPERIVRQYYLPPFQKAVENGALTVMLNSGTLNGVPSHADKYWITDVLKGELGFEGFTISDWDDITNLYKMHRVANNEKEAIKIAVNAGMDMCMEPYDASFSDYLVELVKEGEVSMSRVNDAVRRILRVKKRMGLFDKTLEPEELFEDFGSEKFAQEAYKGAVESITLLKNESSLLPIDKEKKVFLCGVAANSINYLNGAWTRTWSGTDTAYNDLEKMTVLEAMRQIAGHDKVTFMQGTTYNEDINSSQLLSAARNADVIIACLGEIPATEKPSDITDLKMPEVQLEMIRKLKKTGKPIVLVLVEARPRVISDIEALADAVLMAYLPGNEGGRAIAGILYGEENPSGRLPITYPKYTASIWAYDHLKSDEKDAGFGFNGFDPQYEFGHGLSYTEFKYENFKINSDTFNVDDTIRVNVKISNTGLRDGKEVVQLYSSDLVASISPAVKQLRRFQKIYLEAGESLTCTFELPVRELAFVNMNNKLVLEKGIFELKIDSLTNQFYLNSGLRF